MAISVYKVLLGWGGGVVFLHCNIIIIIIITPILRMYAYSARRVGEMILHLCLVRLK